MLKQVSLKDVALHSKGKQINGDQLLENGIYDYLNGGINPSGKWNKYNTEANTVTISEGGNSSGFVNFMTNQFWCGAHCYYLHNLKITPKYLYYALKSQEDRIMSLRTGAAMPNIKKSALGEFVFNIDDDSSTQNKVVNVLDNISEMINKKNQQLSEYDQLIKSRFAEMFGDLNENPMNWNEVLITEVLGGKTSNGFFAKRDDYCENGNVSILGVADIVNRMYSETKGLPRTNASISDIEKFSVKYGDMLFCRSSLVASGIGKASIVPLNTKDTLFECHVIRLQLDLNKCIPEFIQLQSETSYFRNQVLKHAKTSTMTTIGQDGILRTKIILPPLENQKKFLSIIKQVDKLKFEVQKSLDQTQMLFDSLMQEYFG